MSIIKTNDEILNLKKAAKIGSDCFEYICSIIKPGMTEKEIAVYIYDFFIKNGANSSISHRFCLNVRKNEKKNPGNEKEHTSFFFPQG